MHHTVKTIFRLVLAASVLLVTLSLCFTFIVKLQQIITASERLADAEQHHLRSTAERPLVLLSNNQKPDEKLWVTIAQKGYLAQMSCQHYAEDLCVDRYNQKHTRQIQDVSLLHVNQLWYIQNVSYRDSLTQQVSKFEYTAAQIQQFYQNDISELKYRLFAIGLFALAALFASFKLLRNFKQFLAR